MTLRILALEPYYGGSHRAFLDGWIGHSRHDWTLETLPPAKWKWRMRHAAVTFAERTDDISCDRLFCSSMLNLAEFRGLSRGSAREVPAVVYFHENQLTYPVRHESERDYQYVFTNLSTALAADRIWFNSAWHRETFLNELQPFLKRFPDHQPFGSIPLIRERSEIRPPGIPSFPRRTERPEGPLRILWPHRWEHDKNPEDFFQALVILEDQRIDFRLNILGESFREHPPVFDEMQKRFTPRIDRWGYLPSREAYEAALLEADVAVSTARHEFFGIAMLEAAAAGVHPLIPDRLAYPEVFQRERHPEWFHDGTPKDLADKLQELAAALPAEDPRPIAEPFHWERIVPLMDDALESVVPLKGTDGNGPLPLPT